MSVTKGTSPQVFVDHPPMHQLGAPVPGWTPKQYPDAASGAACMAQQSVTGTLLVEPLAADRHADALHNALTARGQEAYAALFTYMPADPPASRDAFRQFVVQLCGKRDPMFFAVLRRQRGASTDQGPAPVPVGMFALLRTDSSNGVTEIGFVLFSPLLQRTTLATDLLCSVMQYVFLALQYRRFEWKCNSRNAPSMAAARRYGFTYEGTFRQALVVKGRNRDTAWWSVLDREYADAVGPALRAWLDDGNFDPASGRQRQTLEVLRQALTRPASKL